MLHRALCFVVLAVTSLATPALAQTPEAVGLQVACFNAERAFAQSPDGKAGIARLDSLRADKSRAIEEKNKALAAQEAALKANADVLNETALAQQTAAVEKFRLDTQRFIEDAQAELAGVQRDVEAAFLVKLKPAMDKVVAARHLSLVLRVDTPFVVWFDPADDITADVVKQLAADAKPQQ